MSTNDELRALCLQAIQAKTPDDLEVSFRALRIALYEDFLDAENLGIHLILQGGKELPLRLDNGEDEKDGTEN